MMFEHFCLTDPGLMRTNNEDAVAFNAEHPLAVLADGMGGYNAGEVAAAMAVDFVQTELGRWLAQGGSAVGAREIKRAIEICIDNANRSIYNAANNEPSYAGMGTTLVVAVFQGSRALIGHVGDSRCYRLRGGRLMQLTRDHSLLQEQIDAGLLTPEQGRHATHRNLVTRALGVEDMVLPEVNEFRTENGDLYLLCSDGLTDMLPDEQITWLLMESGSLEQKARALVDLANDAGGRDNISVILARARSTAPRKGIFSRMLAEY